MNRRGITIGGNVVFDYVKMISTYPKPGNLADILSIQRSVGGALPNTIIDLAKMDSGLPLQAIGVTGADEMGEYVLGLLKNHGIDIGMIAKQGSVGTSFTDVMMVQDTGDRTFFHFRGANSLLGIEHFDFTKINADILHIGYAMLLDRLDESDEEYGTALARLFNIAQQRGMKTSLDTVSESSDIFHMVVPPALKYTDYCTINEIEASLITGIETRDGSGKLVWKNMQPACEALKQMGVKHWAVVHAPEGAFAMDENKIFYVQPSFDLPKGYIKGTVGAGDAFCAGILYSAYKGMRIDEALKVGNAVAASCLAAPGSTDGIGDINDMMRLYDKFKLKSFEEDL